LRNKKNEIIIKILRLSKQEKILEKYKKKMIRASLNSLDELNKFKACEQQEKHKEKTKREVQLLVSASEILAPIDTP
jgi:hypothetical protein